ncbi:NYN domain-containing protein [Azospira sp.]|uniref:NYN domain-containing protein n=1 Tax=Azospira sp. TaxID=1872671 RepID=UPI0025692D88|nr:NYN domain-containing protein [Azospira sp.]MDK9690684.1 NYN domain-containing protein [Azospira sp.]
MAAPADTVSMALFCDFENIALGVRDAQYEKFDIKPVLERLLVKGSIVVKKAYCDWERYKTFKATMHEANFELIEIPHVRQSGKNSADIRLVVDALDLCYTKSHVDTFVIISGDSDFSPLVSKLRENAKHVIGVGVKQSTSDLLIANCDEFIFYDDLVRDREAKRAAANRKDPAKEAAPRRSPEDEKKRKDDQDARRTKGIELAMATFEDLMAERSDTEKLWASVLKEAIKRRNPGFNESYYGFRAFGNLLEEAQNRGLLAFGRDEKSGAYVARPGNVSVREVTQPEESPAEAQAPAAETAEAPAREGRGGNRRRGRGRDGAKENGVKDGPRVQEAAAEAPTPAPAPVVVEAAAAPTAVEAVAASPAAAKQPSGRGESSGARSGARTRARKTAAAKEIEAAKKAPAKAKSEPKAEAKAAPQVEAAPAAAETAAKPKARRTPAKRPAKKAAAE